MVKLKHGRHSSAKKEERKSLRRRKFNKILQDKIHALTRKFKKEISKKDITSAENTIKEIFSYLDKAIKKNTIHINKASREKSKLSKLLNSIKTK